jgi:formylglycine-generating enzyme required for sulfatase activity
MITQVLTLIEGVNAAHDLFGRVTGLFKGSQDENSYYLNQINESLKNIDSKLKFERLSDNIIYTPLIESVRDITRTQQRIISDLQDVRASLEPVQRALGGEIISSAMILTPEKMRGAMSVNPWEVLHNISPANFARPHPDANMVAVSFYHNNMLFIGWQMRGALPILFDCHYESTWTPPLIKVPDERVWDPPPIKVSDERVWTPPPIKVPENGKDYVERINNVELSLVYVPGGTYRMGSPGGEGNENEHLQHSVTVKPFYMGKYPVTQAQYQAVVGNNPSYFKGGDHPVERVSWIDSVIFCKKLSEMTGKTYRLSSESEWEYACRAGSEGKWCFGDNEALLEQYAWYDKNSGSKTHPVGGKLPNAFGLYDMHGNVWEWTCSDYAPYGSGAEQICSENTSNRKTARGSSWLNVSDNTRSAIRIYYSQDVAYSVVGFRILRAL